MIPSKQMDNLQSFDTQSEKRLTIGNLLALPISR